MTNTGGLVIAWKIPFFRKLLQTIESRVKICSMGANSETDKHDFN